MVRRLLGGDPAAAAILFERHLPKLRARVRRRLPAALKSKLGESDVIQESYLAAYMTLGQFEDRGDGSFARWLRGILQNKIAYEVRHLAAGKRDARRETRLKTGAEPVTSTRPPKSASQAAMASQEASTLRAAIDGLPGDYGTVIRLVHLEELTLVEAGERMGRSAYTVRKLYGRALQRLAETLRGASARPE